MIEIRNISKTYATPDGTVEALKNVTISIPDGDIFGIIGMSGAGKSTLVRCMNYLERPDSGTVSVDGCDLGALSERELRRCRRGISMIFQGFHLLMQRNCLQNVCFPLELAGMRRAEAKAKALSLLEIVGLSEKALAYPATLSGGQQQRVAIARALATDPKVLLCDEATSALDPTTTHSILELIRNINETLGITVVIITHQMSVVESICRHVAILDGGQVVETGEVAEVFSHPRSQAARRLVYPEGCTEAENARGEGEHLVRVVFNGAGATGAPLIARMAVQAGVEANILFASAKTIGGKTYGSMLLGLPDEETVHAALAYLSVTPDLTAEEVSRHDAE